MDVVERIDRYRKAAGLSRRQLAIAAGIAPSSLQSALQRGKNISLDMLEACASVLGTPLYTLVSEVEWMAEYHVGCGAFAIYAGTLNSKNKSLWQNKTECTDEAINAVRDYMVQELLGGFDCRKAVSSGYEWTLKDGRVVELRVSVKEVEKGHEDP